MTATSEAYLVDNPLDKKKKEEQQEGGEDMEEEDDDDETNRLSTTSNSRDEVEEIKKIIREETKVVRNWRWVVIIAMLLVGGVVTGATYIFLSNEEEDDFEDSVSFSNRLSHETLLLCSMHDLILYCIFSSNNLPPHCWSRQPLVRPPFVPAARTLRIRSQLRSIRENPTGPL